MNELEDIMLSETPSQRKANTVKFHFYEVHSQIYKDRKQNGGYQRAGGGLGAGFCLMGTELKF